MNQPTAATVRASLRQATRDALDEQGYPSPAGSDPDTLTVEVETACEYLEWVTGQPVATAPGQVPAGITGSMSKAVALRTIQQVYEENPDQLESAADDLTTGFSATGYSENRRAFSDYKSQNEALMINPMPALNRLLWLMMTAERRAWWLAFLRGEVSMPPEALTRFVHFDWWGQAPGDAHPEVAEAVELAAEDGHPYDEAQWW